MKANEFVKNHGWKLVKDLIERGKEQTHVSNDSRMMIDAERYIRECPWFADDVDEMVSLVDLKRLVESYGLVQEHGSLERARKYANSPYTAPEIKGVLDKAIADVESCQ